MAKKSKIAKNEKRKVIVARYATKRLELKKALVDPAGTDESREEARIGLQKLPRNASPAATSRSSVSAVFASAIWRTGANCPELPSQAGRFLRVHRLSVDWIT
jgi:hypothetical protein